MQIILNDKSLIRIKFEILLRKTKFFIVFFLKITFWYLLSLSGYVIVKISSNIYNYLFPKRDKVKKYTKMLIFIYSILVIAWCIFDCFYLKNRFNLGLFVSIIGVLALYWLLKLLLWIYHIYIGKYQLYNEQALYTKKYICEHMDHLIKIYGHTGAGKDTLMAGIISKLCEDFNEKTHKDMQYIMKVCYFIDFELLNQDLYDHYKDYLTFSKVKIENKFLGDNYTEGLAEARKYYIKIDYIKNKIVTPKDFINDYHSFKLNPIIYNGKYCDGVGVNKKHYLELIMYEYIQWWIRLNIEKNFSLTNQPFLENPDTGLTSKQFSFNMLRTKIRTSTVVIDGKKKKITEKVFFPWKDRLVLGETECGTWYMNRDNSVDSTILGGGVRDFKGYNRHFMRDFYWIQVDQAPERTNAMFRELDHAYMGILSRVEEPGGAKTNLLLDLSLKWTNFRIFRLECKSDKNEYGRMKKQQKIDDLEAKFKSSSNMKYYDCIQKIENKYHNFKQPMRYYKLKAKQSFLEKEISKNKKNGYITLTVVIGKTPSSPQSYKPIPIKEIVKKGDFNTTFVTQLVFKTSDCERYDTRYMRNLAEKRSQDTVVELDQVPNWPETFKFTAKEMEWMAYEAAKAQFGISEDANKQMCFGDKYLEHINKN